MYSFPGQGTLGTSMWSPIQKVLLKSDDEDRSLTEDPCQPSSSTDVADAPSPGVSQSGGEEVESPLLTRVKPVLKAKRKVSESSSTSDEGEYKKPGHSYIALISMAILESENSRLLLGDIYKYILDKFPYYKYSDDNAWKNSIRHNLSLNECFIKNGRADNGKGNYWSVHPACIEDFKRGDFRRRQARRRAKRCTQNTESYTTGTSGYVGRMSGAGLSPSPHYAPYHYPYNAGYVPMSSVPSALPGFTSCYAQTPNPYNTSPAAAAATAAYLSAVTTNQLTAANTSANMFANPQPAAGQRSYSGYFQAHGNPCAAPPNVNSTQMACSMPPLGIYNHHMSNFSYSMHMSDSMYNFGNGFS